MTLIALHDLKSLQSYQYLLSVCTTIKEIHLNYHLILQLFRNVQVFMHDISNTSRNQTTK